MTNIRNVLESIRKTLDSFLKDSVQRAEDFVVVSNLTNSDGTRPSITSNKVVLSIANIEQVAGAAGIRGPQGTPSVTTDIYLSVFANFEDGSYVDGLDMLSRVMGYLQDNPILSQANVPGMDSGIERISLEFVNLDAVQWSCYMRMFGITFLPAIMYKVRIVPVRS